MNFHMQAATSSNGYKDQSETIATEIKFKFHIPATATKKFLGESNAS